MDLTPEERREMDGLNRRFLDQALGAVSGDFLLLEDPAGGRLIPYSDAAKRAVPAEIVPRDHEQLKSTLKDLEGQGLTIERRKAA